VGLLQEEGEEGAKTEKNQPLFLEGGNLPGGKKNVEMRRLSIGG